MRYYKLIENNDTFIGIINEKDFRKYQKKHNILLVCDYKSAEYVRFGNMLYRDPAWMSPIQTNNFTFKEIDVINITEQEYDTLADAIYRGEEIKVIIDEEVVTEEIEEEVIEEKDVTVEWMKNSKILEMSVECNKNITKGFNIFLSDGNLYHFSLSIEDQINLLNINSMINTNEKFIYHADDERCRYYSKEDMSMIINKAMDYKTYHTTYFNMLKTYINSLNDIITISNIKYGIELPDRFQHVFLTTYKKQYE